MAILIEKRSLPFYFLCIFLILSSVCISVIDGVRYHAHDAVKIVANTVGPFNNPTETYPVSIYLILLFIIYLSNYNIILLFLVLFTSFL
jgi:uncharacterized membrane protein